LSIGVCDVHLEVDNHVLYEGEVDRGCGNQVFNYAKDVILVDNNEKKAKPNSPKGAPLHMGKEPIVSGTQKMSVTPTMDNVSLFSHNDLDGANQRRSDTRLMNHEERPDVKRPVLGESSPESGEKSSSSRNGKSSSTDKPQG
jgi:hypothetical protein